MMLVTNAHLFEIETRKMESRAFIRNHHPCRAPTDLDREVCAPVPGINLAHAGKISALYGSADRRNILRVIHQGHWLGIPGAREPGALDPIR